MSESIKQRLGSISGRLTDVVLTKLFGSVLTDIADLRTKHNAVIVDLKAISNNTGSANNTVQLTATNVASASLIA